MKPRANILKFLVTVVGGLIILSGCGSQSDPVYKAESAIQGSTEPTSVTNTAGSPKEMNVGDIYMVTFSGTDEDKVSVDFTDVDKSAEFVLAVSSLDGASSSRTVQMSSDESVEMDLATEDDNWREMSASDALDQQLRGIESELSMDPNMTIATPVSNGISAMKAMMANSQATADSSASFRVLSGLSSLSSYTTVRADVKCVGSNVVFYVDSEVKNTNPSDLTDSDVSSICSNFDSIIPREYKLFGTPSDVNNDGKVTVLMTPQVNRLGAMGGGIITGFFFANDLTATSNSNQREIIYILVPDTNGHYGMKIPKSFAMDNLIPGVLPHELQHAINYNQKVLVAKSQAESNWLNEGLSHLSEDILGYGQENPSREEVYLQNPSYYGIVSPGAPGLAERGGIYLFMRYLYEQSADGDKFLWDLLHSKYTGVENLEKSFAGTSADFDQLTEFLLRWNATIVMSSFNLSTDPRFTYKSRVMNGTTGNWEGVCLSCDTEDGRGTELVGVSLAKYFTWLQISLDPTATQFYKVDNFPNRMSFKSKTAGTYSASLIRYK
jgi:hypothetical protein